MQGIHFRSVHVRGFQRKRLIGLHVFFGRGCYGTPKEKVRGIIFGGISCANGQTRVSIVRKCSTRQGMQGVHFRGLHVGNRVVSSSVPKGPG